MILLLNLKFPPTTVILAQIILTAIEFPPAAPLGKVLLPILRATGLENNGALLDPRVLEVGLTSLLEDMEDFRLGSFEVYCRRLDLAG